MGVACDNASCELRHMQIVDPSVPVPVALGPSLPVYLSYFRSSQQNSGDPSEPGPPLRSMFRLCDNQCATNVTKRQLLRLIKATAKKPYSIYLARSRSEVRAYCAGTVPHKARLIP